MNYFKGSSIKGQIRANKSVKKFFKKVLDILVVKDYTYIIIKVVNHRR